MPVRCVLMPPNAQHACRSRAQPTCRSALRFGRRRPSFWRCVLSLPCRRGSPIPARPASHFCRPLEGFELAFLATLSSSIERPRSRLLRRHRRNFGAATRGRCQVGRFLRNGRPRHLVVATAELSPGPQVLVGNAGGSGELSVFPPLTGGGIGRIVPDYVRCSCT